MLGIVLSTILMFSQCKKDAPVVPDLSGSNDIENSTGIGAVSNTTATAIDVSGATSEGGFAYAVYRDFGTTGDSNTQPTISTLRVFEDGKELGAAHTKHADIASIGKGKFSHWGNGLIFSASDNTDPRKNGRKYTFTTGGTPTEILPGTPTAPTTETVLDLSGLTAEGGFAYVIYRDFGTTGDSNTQPSISTLRVFENGKELGAAHAKHADISSIGTGKFSHWGNSLIFSASDNTNPKTNGRKYTVTIGGSATTTPPETVTPPTGGGGTGVIATGLIGYAAVNGTTTGGKGGSEITVSTLQALKSALSSDGPKIIYVSGAIKGAGNDPMYVKSNKSIIGLSGASVEGASFMLYTVNNIIIQNLRIKNYVTNAGVQIKEGSHHIWVDHCEFSADRDHGWEYYGKDISITRYSDYVTVSWNKFSNNNLSVLISAGISAEIASQDIGKLHVTLHHNFWNNISEREPTMNYGSVHLFNNYHLNNSGYSISARAGGNVRTDNDYFANCNKPIATNLAGDPPGYISGSETNIYVNSGKNEITTPLANWAPTYEYKSVLNAAADVPSIVTKGAGATL
ncbi:Pectate lyase [Pedobacter sp. ok626]|uniref:pectate lyase family protein n=1 Tax=Pedobacter sp. ok626 TaxID=1761882 RepID=UPI00088CFAC1|nr:hypothetical protein [Pedobacter sp. ok626]SDJ60461.1 Pectate lyase [Pedobacter sp. ok626]